jgi:branched-chain amino acid transport system substrate-binding protein
MRFNLGRGAHWMPYYTATGRRASLWSRLKARLQRRRSEPFRLGFLADLSGPAADLGRGTYHGVMLAVQAFNADGGIYGRPVELVVRDDHNDPALARQHFVEFADAGIEVVLGPVTSSIALALAPLAEERRVALVSPTVMSAELSGRDDHFFRLTPPLPALARQQARYLHEHGARRLALATGDGNPSYVADYAHAITAAWVQAGGALPTVTPFGGGSGTGFDAAARMLCDAAVDAVLIIAAGRDVARLTTALRRLGTPPLIVSSHWADTASLLQAEGADIDGLIVSQYFDPDSREPRYLDFIERYRQRFSAEPGFAGLFGHDTASYVLAALLRREPGQSIKQAILSVPPQRGLQGRRHMDAMGDGLSPVALARVQGDRLVALDDPAATPPPGPPLQRQLLVPLAGATMLPVLMLWLLAAFAAPQAAERAAALRDALPPLGAALAVALLLAAIVARALARAEGRRHRAIVRAAQDSVDSMLLDTPPSLSTSEQDTPWAELQGLLARLRSSEASAQATRRQLQQVFEATSEVAIVACDLQGRVTVFNRGAEKLLQRAAGDVVWRGHLLDWLHEDDLAALAAEAAADGGPAPQGLEILARRVRRDGHDVRELRWRRADGTLIDVAQAITATRDTIDVPNGYLAVATDLSAHRRAERAAAASRAKSDLLSRVSHELRTPLNAVLGFAQLLQGDTLGTLNAAQQSRVAHIQAAGWHLLSIIDDLLDLARSEAGTLRVRREPVAVGPLVDQALTLARRLASRAAWRSASATTAWA